MKKMDIGYYQAPDGTFPAKDYIMQLRDKIGASAILRAIDKLSVGLGHIEKLSGYADILELKIDKGPGYRVYFAREGKELYILLCTGEKKTQTSDINEAAKNWEEYKSA